MLLTVGLMAALVAPQAGRAATAPTVIGAASFSRSAVSLGTSPGCVAEAVFNVHLVPSGGHGDALMFGVLEGPVPFAQAELLGYGCRGATQGPIDLAEFVFSNNKNLTAFGICTFRRGTWKRDTGPLPTLSRLTISLPSSNGCVDDPAGIVASPPPGTVKASISALLDGSKVVAAAMHVS
jgi:hypothetical protein